MWGQPTSRGMSISSLGSENRVYVYFCEYCYGGCDDPMRQIRVGAEGSMGLYYWKHMTRMHSRDVTTPRVLLGVDSHNLISIYLISP